MGLCSNLFRLDHVSLVRGDRRILDDVSVAIDSNGVTVLVGPSGAGKTTLLRLLNRLEVADSGRIWFDGDDIALIDPRVLRRRVGMVFQKAVVFEGSVRANLHVAAVASDDDDAASLIAVGLDPARLDGNARDLSGGEAQRLCLARALRTGPSALLMDEPTSALDGDSRREIESLARELADGGVPIVWVTHDEDQVRRLADRVLVVDAGRVTERDDGGMKADRQ